MAFYRVCEDLDILDIRLYDLRRTFATESMAGEAESVSPVNYWRPRRDLNPCYRRERAVS
jgi:hypothetical protein